MLNHLEFHESIFQKSSHLYEKVFNLKDLNPKGYIKIMKNCQLQHDINAMNLSFFISIFVITNKLNPSYSVYIVHYHCVFIFIGKGLNN